jgi:GntR family transcriptional regulator
MDQSRPEPPSRTIAANLRAKITTGEYTPGDRLPSERDLAAEFGTARNTAREAIGQLAAEGLVDVQHGRGVFVRTEAPLIRLGASRYARTIRDSTGLSPFRAEAAAQGKTARVDVPSISRVPAPADVAERLGLTTRDKVVARVNHYFTDDEPLQIGTTYIPHTIARGSVLASKAKTGTGSIYARFAELGHDITSVREEITARMPRPDETETLAIPPGVPVIELLHTGIDQDGRPFEVTRFVMRADRSGLDYSIPIGEPE